MSRKKKPYQKERSLAAPVVAEPKAEKAVGATIVGQYQVFRIPPDISRWRAALYMAERPTDPRRRSLIDIYQELVLDSSLTVAMSKILLRCTNSPIRFHDQDGQVDMMHPINVMMQTSAFRELVTYIIESKWYGHSLVEPVFDTQGTQLLRVDLIERRAVVPETGEVLKEAGDQSGIQYRMPPYSAHLCEFGSSRDLGLLNAVAPLIIYKRQALRNWAEYCESFGIPWVIAEYDPNVPNARSEAIKAMKDRGAATELILPIGSNVKIEKGADSNGNNLFDSYVSAHNKEITKIFLLQTMTTDNGSSLSQAQVHQESEDQAIQGYKLFIEQSLNEKFMKLLRLHGFDVPIGAYFKFDDTEQLKMAAHAEVLSKLAEHGKIPLDYIEKHFGIKLEPKAETTPTPAKPSTGKKDKGASLALDLDLPLHKSLNHVYNLHKCCTNHEQHLSGDNGDFMTNAEQKLLEKAYNEMLNRLHKSGGTNEFDLSFIQEVAKILTGGVTQGFFGTATSGANDITGLYDQLKYNTFVFSAAKNYNELQELSAMLRDGNDKLRTFEQFRKEVMASGKYQIWNREWLRAEYNHAVSSSMMAARWKNIVADSDTYPYLRYDTVGDERVRNEHRGLDGVVRPVFDEFWDKWYPPNGWNCRCDVSPTDVQTEDPTDFAEPSNVGLMFQTNVGKTGLLYPDTHPYFEAINKQAARKLELHKVANKALFEVIKSEGYFTDVSQLDKKYKGISKKLLNTLGYDEKKGGFIALHEGHEIDSLRDELPTCIFMKDHGFGIRLINEMAKPNPIYDIIVDGKSFDLKRIQNAKNIKNGLEGAFDGATKKQKENFLIDIAINTTEQELKNALNGIVKQREIIKDVWVVLNKKLTQLNREQILSGDYTL